MSFTGADVDGLDQVARDCQEAAEVVDAVKAACEAIVAASFLFGPFGAAFISYLKTVVIPWLTKISEALKLFAQVLQTNAQAQRDASAPAPTTYSTPTNLPTTTTSDYPTLPSTTTSTSYLGGLITVTNTAAGAITPTYDSGGHLVSVEAKGNDELSVNGIPLVRLNGDYVAHYQQDPQGNLDGMKVDMTGGVVLGPGTPQGPTESDIPGGVKLFESPSAESTGLNYRPPEANLQLSEWFGSYGWGASGSGFAHTPELTGGLGGGGEDGLSGGVTGELGASAQGNFFLGSYHDPSGTNDVSGVALGGDAVAGWKLHGGGAYNGESSGGYLGFAGGPEENVGAGGYLIQRNGIDYLGGFGEFGPGDLHAGFHTPDRPE